MVPRFIVLEAVADLNYVNGVKDQLSVTHRLVVLPFLFSILSVEDEGIKIHLGRVRDTTAVRCRLLHCFLNFYSHTSTACGTAV